MTYDFNIGPPGPPRELEPVEVKPPYAGINAFFAVATLLLLAVSPALVILVWKAAL